MGGADSRGAKAADGGEVWGGVCARKKIEFLPETGGFCCIVGLLFSFKKA